MFKSFFKIMMMAMAMFIIDGEGGGSDIDAEPAVEPAPTPAAAAVDDGSITLSKADLDAIGNRLKAVDEITYERDIAANVTDIKGRHADFDIEAVRAKLTEINKTDPATAKALNNANGWELLWMRDLAPKTVTTDAVSTGRHVIGDGDRSEVVERLARGEGSRFDAQDLLEKYL